MDQFNVSPIKIGNFIPQYYAQECPVCHGFGTLRHGSKQCQGCQGKGYVVVPTGMDGGNYGQTEKLE